MICVLTNRHITSQIVSLAGLDPQTTANELREQPEHFEKFNNFLVQAYGLEIEQNTARPSPNDADIGYFRVILQSNDREKIMEGLAVLNPLSIAVEPSDLDNLVPKPMIASVMRDCWGQIQADLTRIPAAELIDRLERAARKLIFAKRPEQTAEESVISEIGFSEWCRSNGIREPQTKTPRELRAEYEAKLRREAANRPHSENTSSWSIREF